MIKLVDIHEPGLMDQLQQLMHDDGHNVPAVTTLIMDNNTVIGAYSKVYLPVIFAWFHSERATKISCYRAYNQIVDRSKKAGFKRIGWMIQKDSPFYPYLGRLGVSCIGSGEVFI